MVRQLGRAALMLSLMTGAALAQSAVEDAKAAGKDVKREVKKGANRVDETFCTGTKTECASKKGRHRFQEAREKAVDKVDQTKDKIDSNGT